jgi:hypothetical protein
MYEKCFFFSDTAAFCQMGHVNQPLTATVAVCAFMQRGRRGVEQTNSSVISSATSLERCDRLDSGASADVAGDRNQQSHTESMGATVERGQIMPSTATREEQCLQTQALARNRRRESDQRQCGSVLDRLRDWLGCLCLGRVAVGRSRCVSCWWGWRCCTTVVATAA